MAIRPTYEIGLEFLIRFSLALETLVHSANVLSNLIFIRNIFHVQLHSGKGRSMILIE